MSHAANLISKIDRVIKSRKKNILVLAYHQGVIFNRFIENGIFTGAVTDLKINKSTINFKIGIVELIHDYPKMKKAGLPRTLIGISIIF